MIDAELRVCVVATATAAVSAGGTDRKRLASSNRETQRGAQIMNKDKWTPCCHRHCVGLPRHLWRGFYGPVS
jgi:hypothetical protein